MSLFLTSLAREWREHRSALILCWGVSALLSLWVVTYLDTYTVRVELVPLLAVLQGLVLYVVTVGGSLLSAHQRNATRFHERLPGGLSSAFLARVTFYALGLMASGLVSWLALAGGAIALIGVAPETDQSLGLTWAALAVGAPALAWTMTASAWVPRSGLALPVGLFSLAFLAWPYLTMAALFRESFVVEPTQSVVFSALMTLASIPAALVAYRIGRGYSSREVLAGIAALGMGCVFASPSWAWILISRPSIPERLEWSGACHWPNAALGSDGVIYTGQDECGSIPWQSATGSAFYRLEEESGSFKRVRDFEPRGLFEGPRLEGLRSSAQGSGGLRYPLDVGGVREWRYCDRDLRFDFSLAEVFGEAARYEDGPSAWIEGDSWIVRPSSSAPLYRFDPWTATRSKLNWPVAEFREGFFGLMLHDGRFLWNFDEGVFLGDPLEGTYRSLDLPDRDYRFHFRDAYQFGAVKTGDGRPIALHIGSSLYLLEGNELVPGPCLFESNEAWLFGYRVRDGSREFLWQNRDGSIWMSRVDTGEVQRLFPPEDAPQFAGIP